MAALAVLVAAASAIPAQRFRNAGFESPRVATGSFAKRPAKFSWHGAFNCGIANGSGSWGTGAHGGRQYAYVESDGLDYPNKQAWMEQTVGGFHVGWRYKVTF